jgi:hypothetical protein
MFVHHSNRSAKTSMESRSLIPVSGCLSSAHNVEESSVYVMWTSNSSAIP